ncbi:MAG: uroporphyrinogen decarboxylase family protein [Bacteroidales bacterium]
MTNDQWNTLLQIVQGNYTGDPVTGFIIDSPWIPGWYGTSHLNYYGSERVWMEANRKVIDTFPGTIFLPGFWSEYGMCTEPSAFGAKCIWKENQMPHADRIIRDASQIVELRIPNPATDGLLPLMIQRLEALQPEINGMGHEIKFAIARGPLNIASFLMGTSELMLAMMLQPDEIHNLLRIITDFTSGWIRHQHEKFPTIEGILLLDDIVGFIGEEEVKSFAVPYITEIFTSIDAKIRFFHNDANGLVSTPFIGEMGVNLYNFSFEHSINQIRQLAGEGVALLGNLPPRDVLAAKSADEVREETVKMVNEVTDKSRIIWSCGGGMPPDVATENIEAFIETIKNSV